MPFTPWFAWLRALSHTNAFQWKGVTLAARTTSLSSWVSIEVLHGVEYEGSIATYKTAMGYMGLEAWV